MAPIKIKKSLLLIEVLYSIASADVISSLISNTCHPQQPHIQAPSSITTASGTATLQTQHHSRNPPYANYFAGFNVGTYTKQGKCKSLDDWKRTLEKIKSFSNDDFTFNRIKIFTTSECHALSYSLEAAQTVGGIKIWAGIWVSGEGRFAADKLELEEQLKGDRGQFIQGVIVGSEELFRGTSTPFDLAGHIRDVKETVQNNYRRRDIVIGTSDSVATFVDPANRAVLDACDVVLITDYPYYGGVHVENALAAFQHDYYNVKSYIKDKPLIVGETGWPSLGLTIGYAVPGAYIAGRYYKAAACWMRLSRISFFWFEAIDEEWKHDNLNTAETRFGVSWDGGPSKYSLRC